MITQNILIIVFRENSLFVGIWTRSNQTDALRMQVSITHLS